MADEKVMVVCKEAGVEIGSGAMILITIMGLVYNAVHNLSVMIINLIK